jgi:hypothetical protein
MEDEAWNNENFGPPELRSPENLEANNLDLM